MRATQAASYSALRLGRSIRIEHADAFAIDFLMPLSIDIKMVW